MHCIYYGLYCDQVGHLYHHTPIHHPWTGRTKSLVDMVYVWGPSMSINHEWPGFMRSLSTMLYVYAFLVYLLAIVGQIEKPIHVWAMFASCGSSIPPKAHIACVAWIFVVPSCLGVSIGAFRVKGLAIFAHISKSAMHCPNTGQYFDHVRHFYPHMPLYQPWTIVTRSLIDMM
jgi:hypothetical protein